MLVVVLIDLFQSQPRELQSEKNTVSFVWKFRDAKNFRFHLLYLVAQVIRGNIAERQNLKEIAGRLAHSFLFSFAFNTVSS